MSEVKLGLHLDEQFRNEVRSLDVRPLFRGSSGIFGMIGNDVGGAALRILKRGCAQMEAWFDNHYLHSQGENDHVGGDLMFF